MDWLDSISKFRETILEFLWTQWSGLGIHADSSAKKAWIADPEALLIASIDLGRYDPRLFDAVAAWAKGNAPHLDARRLKILVKKRPETVLSALSALIRHLDENQKSSKWSILKGMAPKAGKPVPLFRRPDGRPQDTFGKQDPFFRRSGLLRPPLEWRSVITKLPPSGWLPLRIRMRGVIGISVRAEIFSVLLVSGKAHPARIASWIDAASRTVSQTMRDMASSGIIRGEPRGRLVEYSLLMREHWEKIARVKGQAPPWIDWPRLLFASCDLARLLEDPGFESASSAVQGSLVTDAWSILWPPLNEAGWDARLPFLDSSPLNPSWLGEVTERLREELL